MRKLLIPAMFVGSTLLAAAAPTFAGNGTPLNPNSKNVLTLAVYGDSPYGTTPTDTSETEATPAFVDSINADPKVDLVLHVGDIHSGKQYCTEDYDRTIYDLWKGYKNPLIYTPGDNEWTDCNKIGEGGGLYNASTHQIDYVLDANHQPVDYAKGNPVANLALIRSIFFSQPGYSLGGRSKQVLTQAQSFDPAYPQDAQFVENVIWEQSKVVFVAINLTGGSNDDADVWYAAPNATQEQVTEAAQRKAADLRWLNLAFQIAQADGAEAVLIMAQADMWDVTDSKGAAHASNYEAYVKKVADSTLEFGKPVLMFNGDSHVYQSGNPLDPADPVYSWHPGYNVPNFHRVVVHGSTFPLEWLKVTVTPGTNAPQGASSFGPFSWERMIQQ